MTKIELLNHLNSLNSSDEIVVELPNGDRFVIDFASKSNRQYPTKKQELVLFATEEYTPNETFE